MLARIEMKLARVETMFARVEMKLACIQTMLAWTQTMFARIEMKLACIKTHCTEDCGGTIPFVIRVSLTCIFHSSFEFFTRTATPFVESPSPPAVSLRGEKVPKADEGGVYASETIWRRWPRGRLKAGVAHE
jgi:hypothetical protein